MKKTISILLALAMVLGLAACMKVKAADTPATETKNANVAVTAAPTQAPTPEPTAVPFDVAIAEANEKLQQVKSMHLDMEMTMGLTISISMGEMNQTMPMDIHMLYVMDIITDPYVAKMDLSLSGMGQEEQKGTIYATRDGENTILYTSDDEGVTWKTRPSICSPAPPPTSS